MSVRTIAASLVLLCGCTTAPAPSAPTESPATAAPAQIEVPAYDPAAVVAGVYLVDIAAALDAVEADMVQVERGDDVARTRETLGLGSARLVFDSTGEVLVLFGVESEPMKVEILSLVADADGFELRGQEHPERAHARCVATSETRLECEFEVRGSGQHAPLPLVLERESTAEPGLPESGLYGWQPAGGMEVAAEVEAIQSFLVSDGLDVEKARALATDMVSRPSLNIVAGDSLWTLTSIVASSEDPSDSHVEREVFPSARMTTTADGFQIERRMPDRPGTIVEDCRLMDAGFACRSGGRESLYERRATRPAR